MELKNTVCVITGGGTGIGRATGLLLAESGMKVVVCGRRLEPLMETVSLINNSRGGVALALQCDVTDEIKVASMVKKVLEHFGSIDVLVNNAGIIIVKAIVETTEKEWDEIINTNLKGVFFCCKAVLPYMMERGNGLIVNVSSVLGKMGIANFGAYCTSKFGLLGFTQTLAEEVKARGIKIYAVCPGSTKTDLHCKAVGKQNMEAAMSPEKVGAKIKEIISWGISLPSGSALTIDEQPSRLPKFTIARRLEKQVIKWLKPTSPLLCWLRNKIKKSLCESL